MGTSVLPSILFFTLLLFEDITITSATSSTLSATSSEDTQNVVEVLKCFRYLQESGKRIYIKYIGSANVVRIFDSDGVKVSCNESEQQKIRQRTDRRCIFSPIHCLFNKRLLSAKLISKPSKFASPTATNRLYFLRRK